MESVDTCFEDFLDADKILFTFLSLAFRITAKDPEYKKKPSPRLLVHIPITELSYDSSFDRKPYPGITMKPQRCSVTALSLRQNTTIGASLPCEIVYGLKTTDAQEDHIDVVLSLRVERFWPKCAIGWRDKYKDILDEELFKQIIEEGVSVMCKTPDVSYENTRRTYFRLSFSMAESAIFESISDEQKESYKLLKIIRELDLTEVILMDTLEIGSQLKKCLPSYLLKTVCFSIIVGNKEKKSCREWLVQYLNQLIVCLEEKSIKHHFIDDLELLERVTVNYDRALFLKNCIDQSYYESTFPIQKFKEALQTSKSKYRLKEVQDEDKKNGFGELYDKYMVLREIFEMRLTNLPEDLTKLKLKCSPIIHFKHVLS